MMSGPGKSFHEEGDLEVGRTGAGSKEKELLLYFHIFVPTDHSCAKSRRYIKHSCSSPISPIIISLFPKRKGEDKDGVIRACNRK